MCVFSPSWWLRGLSSILIAIYRQSVRHPTERHDLDWYPHTDWSVCVMRYTMLLAPAPTVWPQAMIRCASAATPNTNQCCNFQQNRITTAISPPANRQLLVCSTEFLGYTCIAPITYNAHAEQCGKYEYILPYYVCIERGCGV